MWPPGPDVASRAGYSAGMRVALPFLLCGLLPAQDAVPEPVLKTSFAPTVQELFGHVRFLASDPMGGRKAGTPEAEIAAVYIAAELAKLGLEPAGDEGGFEQRFGGTVMELDAQPDEGARRLVRKDVVYRNVLAWLRGSDPKLREEYLLVGAHFDHLGKRGESIRNGADDNASGVAGMLGVARALVKGALKPRRSVLFVAFGAEERGLRGSRHLVENPPRPMEKLVAMVNLDMIGRGTFLDLKSLAMVKALVGLRDRPAVGVLGTEQSPELSVIVRAVFGADGMPVHAPEDFPGLLRGIIDKKVVGRGDHAPFEKRGIPSGHATDVRGPGHEEVSRFDPSVNARQRAAS